MASLVNQLHRQFSLRVTALVGLLLCSYLSFAGSGASVSTVSLGTGDWPPLISPEAKGFGPISQIVVESFEQVGIAPSIRFWPWSRAIENLNEGNVDASYAWRITDERLEKYFFSEPVYDTGNVFFYRKGYPFDWETLEDLKAYKIAGVQDYAYSNELVEAEAAGDLKLDRVVDEKQLVFLLLAGRIDAFPASHVVGKELIRKYAPEQEKDIAIHPQWISKNPLYLITLKTKQGQQMLERFNQGLTQLKESGRYDAIYNHFQ
ncbi:substrate-binding periplasmic protein [Litoribrevibacter albus]|uniref:Amino acid ABC transporter substrate-binding protein n=1 Tax=Litoribrevibacter albus TaxID=1473156 RepID=A0AA37W8J0_9GAMM|nr:transporter substrate-binding domain-containing protein [Litoribrevibacter albus]GLQ32533.1 amino acid ABC transporter substrate-binding protein [Litoribrevibacter albus]